MSIEQHSMAVAEEEEEEESVSSSVRKRSAPASASSPFSGSSVMAHRRWLHLMTATTTKTLDEFEHPLYQSFFEGRNVSGAKPWACVAVEGLTELSD